MITEELSKKVLEVVDVGLCSGVGIPQPGEMCVEAAVCYALGEPHGARPSCVNRDVRRVKIQLNDDERWDSTKARAKGMRRLAIAQLGTKENFDEEDFRCRLIALLLSKYVAAYHKPMTAPIEELETAKFDDVKALQDLAEKYLGCWPNSQTAINMCNGHRIHTKTTLAELCEDVVQILIAMKTEGSKFLYLTEGESK